MKLHNDEGRKELGFTSLSTAYVISRRDRNPDPGRGGLFQVGITYIVFVLNFHYKLPVISLGGGSPGWMDIPICTSELNKYNLRLKSLTFPICRTILIKGIFLKSGYRIEIVSKIKIQII